MYFPRYSLWVLISGLVVLGWIYGFSDILTMRPQGIHQWRQCDCLAFTQTYYQDGNNFFQPQVLYLSKDGTGKTASDFPLIYYTVAQLWKIFGKHEFIYRGLVLLLAFFGLLALFRMAEDMFKDSFIALWICFIMYSSPIIVFYSNNFLMNVPALSFALIGLYFFYQFYKRRKNKYLYFSMLFYAIGGLLKVPALTTYAAIVIALILEHFRVMNLKKDLFFDLKRQIPALLAVPVIVFAWYAYAHWYNDQHNNGLFLIGILPIWDISWEKIKHVIEYANILWKTSYQSVLVQVLAGLMYFIVLFFRKKNHPLLWWGTLILSLGFVAFIALWFQVFDNHDYYLINQLIFMVVIFLSFFYLIKKNYPGLAENVFFRLILVAILVVNVSNCRKVIHLRYYGWPNEDYLKYDQALEDITPYLRNELHISEKDKVFFLHDQSFNISLYLMDQKGYTDYGGLLKDTAFVNRKIAEGVKYLFINDSSLLGEPYLKPYVNNRIGKYKNIFIYKLDRSVP